MDASSSTSTAERSYQKNNVFVQRSQRARYIGKDIIKSQTPTMVWNYNLLGKCISAYICIEWIIAQPVMIVYIIFDHMLYFSIVHLRPNAILEMFRNGGFGKFHHEFTGRIIILAKTGKYLIYMCLLKSSIQ